MMTGFAWNTVPSPQSAFQRGEGVWPWDMDRDGSPQRCSRYEFYWPKYACARSASAAVGL